MSITTDAPDWQPHVSQAAQIGVTGLNAAIPAKISTGGPHGAAAAWGPDPVVTYGLGAAYEILITPVTGGNAFISDVQVDHLDSASTVVYREFYSVSNLSNQGFTGGTTPQAGVIIRGTLHGTKLRLSGTTVSQANMNTIIGTAVFTVTGINITYYSLSQLLSQTLPKVASLGCTGYLAFATGLSIAAGTTFNYGALPGYCGRAFLTVRSPGGGSGFYARILSFTVGNGTTALYTIYSQEATTLSAETGPVELAMDQLFHTFQITNPSTVTGTTDTNLVAADYL